MSIRKWKINEPDENKINELASKFGINRFEAKLLASRGITYDNAKNFLQSGSLGDPLDIKDMDKAVSRINKAIENGERICIFGDYDCDGVCSTVILEDYLQNAGADVWHYIPDRANGYGMNEDAIRFIADDGTDLIITVDNGISAIAEAELIYELGMQLVVTDHHQVGEVLPKAEAVVNPHRPDDASGFDGYCGAGVAFRLVCALEDGDNEFITEQYGDLAALATIGDIVPLVKDNRIIVKEGLPLIENTQRPGLKYLTELSGAGNSAINSASVAYRIVPRINAAGRFSNAELAVELLMCEDEDRANALAVELCKTNENRRAQEVLIFEKIEKQIRENPNRLNNRVLVFSGEGWHFGVLGIVAARLLENYRKPVIVLSVENGVAHGSARSIEGFSIYDALTSCSDKLIKFGGHHKAAGLTLNADDISEFERQLEEYATANFPEMPSDYAVADLIIRPNEITVENILGALNLEPFGEENPKPTYAIIGAKITAVKPLKEGKFTQIHLDYNGVPIQAVTFKIQTEDLIYRVGDTVDMLVSADLNTFKGNTRVSFLLIDIRPTGFNENKYFKAKAVYEDMKSGKGINKKFIPRVMPERDDMVKLYKQIKLAKTTVEKLYFFAVKEGISYAMMMTALDAFCECKIAEFDAVSGKINAKKSENKVDLMNTKIITYLKGQ